MSRGLCLLDISDSLKDWRSVVLDDVLSLSTREGCIGMSREALLPALEVCYEFGFSHWVDQRIEVLLRISRLKESLCRRGIESRELGRRELTIGDNALDIVDKVLVVSDLTLRD